MEKINFEHVSVYLQNSKENLVTAIEDVSFCFAANKISVIVGYSGSGKTTLLKCLTGSLVYEGKITFDDVDIETIPVQKRKLSYMDQSITLYPNANVYENILFPLKAAKMDHDEADQRVKDVANKLGIDFLLTRKTKYLSLGQASRVCLAKALVKDSEIYIFDEISKNLDAATGKEICNLTRDMLREKQKTGIYVTHDINEATAIADYIYVLNEGKLVGVFTPKEFAMSENEIVKSLLAS